MFGFSKSIEISGPTKKELDKSYRKFAKKTNLLCNELFDVPTKRVSVPIERAQQIYSIIEDVIKIGRFDKYPFKSYDAKKHAIITNVVSYSNITLKKPITKSECLSVLQMTISDLLIK